jgi:quercetin dioxygenase-like cupin family protein
MPYFQTNFPNIKSFTENFIEKYGGKLEMVMIVSLPPEKTVYPHIDDGEYYKIRDRFHLVLQGMYQYNVGEETAIFSKGELWFFENQVKHDSKNIGSVDRISVIFDVLDSNWREICNVN